MASAPHYDADSAGASARYFSASAPLVARYNAEESAEPWQRSWSAAA
ncbi:MAG TPA: hypothetical protein VF221_04085 [Chloroflexota bacterium]